MRRPPKTLALGLFLAAVALAPDAPNPGEPDPSIGKSFRVPYRITDTNHFLVRVRINGKGPFNFLVDTGAPALFISTHAAKAAGLAEPKDDFWAVVERFDFEGGATLRGVKGRIEDPFQLVGMNALGLPGASIDGILGFTMLARFKIELDPTQDRMVWTRLDYNPKEPFVPRGDKNRKAPAEVQAMNLLGPLAKGMAALIGKQVPDTHVPRGGLGIELKEAGGSVEIAKVLDASPAAKAGLKPGDVLLELYPLAKPAASGSRKPDSIAAALKAISGVRPGDKVRLSIRRAPQTLDITAIAGEGF
jgi:hypothetical protein